jgi:hypothetical protein
LLRTHLSSPKKINLSSAFAGQAVGMNEVEEGIWLVSFMNYDLGYVDLEERPATSRPGTEEAYGMLSRASFQHITQQTLGRQFRRPDVQTSDLSGYRH